MTPVSNDRIGRYEVLGRLALGGMAEILLGRLRGPSGFERVVVIKRVLAQLAQERDFTAMFLDEARIAAAIRHPNVVQVHELGEERDELYLVMEYLEGESLQGVLRRLAIVDERFPAALVAHVGAMACAGLHAAHEMCDGEGNPSGLVHRDVSPQNVFVTYDGAVKVLDFGIAKAADRITETEAGTIKGKFAYMSPEQCLGEPLDRRSDVFALGVVLFELLTGHRLFHRGAHVKTLQAVLEGAVPRPSELVEDVPPALEAVVLRALARDPAERYPTTAAMRRALIEAAATFDGPRVPDEALAELMRRLFPDRIQEKSEMVSRARAGKSLSALPAAEADVQVELPTVGAPSGKPDPIGPAERPTTHRGVLAISIAALVATAGGLGWVASEGAASPAEPTAVAAPESAPLAPSGATAATETPVAAATEDEAVEAPAGPSSVALHVESVPPGASVAIDERQIGRTPLDAHLERSTDPVRLTVRRDGVEHAQTITLDHDLQVAVVLVPPRSARPRARPREPVAPAPAEPARAPREFAAFD